jgi:hypothetical protein
MKIYEKPFIKRSVNYLDRENRYQIQKANKTQEEFSPYYKKNKEKIQKYKEYHNNKDLQLKQLSVNKGYKNLDYYLDEPSNTIRSGKHSSSTSKNIVYNFKNIDKTIVFKKPNNIKDYKNNYFHKNSKTTINEKLKNLIMKVSSKKMMKKYYNKWIDMSRKNGKKNNKKYYNDYEEEEIYENAEEKEEKDEKYSSSINLEEIKERAPEEEESTIGAGLKNKNKKESFPLKNKIILKNVLRYKNRLKFYFTKWTKLIYDSLSSNESNISNNDNNYDYISNNSKKLKKEEKNNDVNNKKKKISSNQLNSNNDREKIDKKKFKRLKLLKKVIENIDDYKNISFTMNKWYNASKKIKNDNSKNGKKHKSKNKDSYNNISRYNKDYDNPEESNTERDKILTNSTMYNIQKDEMSNSENSPRILALSSNIIIPKSKSKRNKSEVEKGKEKNKSKSNKNNNKKIKHKNSNEINDNNSTHSKNQKSLDSPKKNKDLINGTTPVDNIDNNYNQVNDNKSNSKSNNYDKKTLKEKINKIKKRHKNSKSQRYLLIKQLNSKKKKNDTEDVIDSNDLNTSRESFTTISVKVKIENKQKILLKIFAKAHCKRDLLMNYFDKWFDATFNDPNYTPFMNEESIAETDNRSKSSKMKSKSKKPKKNQKKSEDTNDAKTSDMGSIQTNNNIDMKDIADSYTLFGINKSPDSKGKTKSKNKNNEKKNDLSKTKSKEINLDSLNSNTIEIEDISLDTKEEFNRSLNAYNNNEENKSKKNDYDINVGELNNIIVNKKSGISNSAKKDKNAKNLKKINNIININNNIINISDKHIGENYQKSNNNKDILINNLQYSNEDDINPSLLDLDFKESKKSKKYNKKDNEYNNEDNNLDKQYSKKEKILIKKIKKAFHKLRVVIRAFKKRKKNTFNPDIQMKEDFQNWVTQTFPDGLEKYRELKTIDTISYHTNNSKKSKKKKKSKSELKEKKLKTIIKFINKKNESIYEDEDYIYNSKKKYFYKWYDMFNEIKYKEPKKKVLKKSYTDLNNNNDVNKKKQENKNQTEYSQSRNKAKRNNKYYNYSERNEYPIIHGNEYSDADSNKDEDTNGEKDYKKYNLTKSQEILKFIPRAKSKKQYDNNENSDEFYSMNVNKKKMNKNISKKLFDKIYDKLENNYYKGNKKNINENIDEDEMEYLDNNLEISSKGNSDQKKKRIKIPKENENKKGYYDKGDEEDYKNPRKEEKQEKKEKEKEHVEIYKNNQNILSDSFHSSSQQNNFGTPKKLPMYDPYKEPGNLQQNPKVQAPRQVLELEKLKGKSKLPDVQRTNSHTKKKFGSGNIDYAEPGELVSSTKLKLLNNMLSGRKSDFGILNNQRNDKIYDFNLSVDSKFRTDSDYEEKLIKIEKKLARLIENINNLKLVSKIFTTWKFLVKKEMSNTRVTMLDCAPPPKKEKKSASIPVIFLSKSISGKSNDDLISIEPESYQSEKKGTPIKRNEDGRYEILVQRNKEDSNSRFKQVKNYIKEKLEEEEIEDDFEEMSDKDFNNYFNNKSINKKVKGKNNASSSKNKQQSPYKKNVNKNRVNKANNETNNENNFKENYNSLIPEIELYKLNNNGNRIKNNIMNLIRNTPSSLSKELNPQTFLDISKKLNKYYTAYQIYILYSLFNQNHAFYDKRRLFNKLKALSNLKPNQSINKPEFLYYDCENNNHCKGCFCFNKRNKYTLLKRIVMKYNFMKEYNPMKYFLNYWYKITFF